MHCLLPTLPTLCEQARLSRQLCIPLFPNLCLACPLLLCRAGRGLKQDDLLAFVSNTCDVDVYITAFYTMLDDDDFKTVICTKEGDGDLCDLIMYNLPDGDTPVATTDFLNGGRQATPPGVTAVSMEAVSAGFPTYVSVSYASGEAAILQGLTPVWLSDSGKECPEGFEESCSLAYEVSRVQ